jgi:hypothetical protein
MRLPKRILTALSHLFSGPKVQDYVNAQKTQLTN